MDREVRAYLASIGRRGGRKSRRRLDPGVAREMVRLREARRGFRRFHTQCFWSSDPHYVVTEGDIPWVADQLRKFGGRAGWDVAARLCR
jgi:hypothetical protein